MDKAEYLDESCWRKITLGGNVHQKLHDLIIKLDLSYRGQEFLLSLLVHSLLTKEMLRDGLEKNHRIVIVALVWAPKVDTVDQRHVAFLCQLNIDQVFYQVESVWLRKLLKNESCLLLVLVQHLSHETAAHDTDDWFYFTVFFKEEIYFLDI